MVFGFGSSEDVSAFKFLFIMAVGYGLVSMLTYSVIHMKFIVPLHNDAPLDRFSEGRAIQHVRVLSHEIDGRHVSFHNVLADFSKSLVFFYFIL